MSATVDIHPASELSAPPPATPLAPVRLDRIVVACAVLVASGIGVASYVHLGLAAWLAAVIGLVVFVLAIALHRLEMRTADLPALSADIAALQGAIDRLDGIGRNAGPELRVESRAEPRSGRIATERTVAPHRSADPMAVSGDVAMAQPSRVASAADPHLSGMQPWPEPDEFAPSRPVSSRTPAEPRGSAPMPPASLSRAPTRTTSSVEHLERLVKELAREAGGARASTPDPDRLRAPVPKAPPTRSMPADGAVPPAPVHRSGEGHRLAEAIEAERVDVYLEPIQGLDDRKPRHFEISVRLRDGNGTEIASPRALNALARANGLGPKLDAVKLPRVALVADRVRSNGRVSDVLTTLNGESLADQSFLDRLAGAFATERPAGIVLAFSQADVRMFGRLHWETLATMAELGLRFAMEDVVDLDMDFEALRTCHFEFVKLDAGVFLSGLPAAGGAIPAADVCRYFSGLGMALVVGRIDDERLLARILGFGVLLGQGTLFGGPRPVRQDVLSRAAA